jgi:mRNA interferase HigB
MRVVGRDKIDEFCAEHADARLWIANWLAETEAAQWRTSQDIKRSYATASFLAGNLVIFNVKGNHYRLEVQLAYQTGIVVIRWVGTHAEYTKRIGQKP